MLVAQRRKGPSFIIRDFTDFLLDFDLAEYQVLSINNTFHRLRDFPWFSSFPPSSVSR